LGKRSTARKLAMQVLYQRDLSDSPIEESIAEVSEREGYLKDTIEFAEKLAHGAWDRRAASDAAIIKLSKNWSIERMGMVVVSILRLAMYELSSDDDTPRSVVINEAVELAKKFATDEAAKFINGILGAYLKEKEKCSRA
jgi:N utilization substance protein B